MAFMSSVYETSVGHDKDDRTFGSVTELTTRETD